MSNTVNDNELTTTFKVLTIGLEDTIEALSFQDAAQKMLEKRGLKSVLA